MFEQMIDCHKLLKFPFLFNMESNLHMVKNISYAMLWSISPLMLAHGIYVVIPHNYPQLDNSHCVMTIIFLEAIKFWHKELFPIFTLVQILHLNIVIFPFSLNNILVQINLIA